MLQEITEQQQTIRDLKYRLNTRRTGYSLEDYMRLFLNRSDELTSDVITDDASGVFVALYHRLKELLSPLSPIPIEHLEAVSIHVKNLNAIENSIFAIIEKIRQTESIGDERERETKKEYWIQLLETYLDRHRNLP